MGATYDLFGNGKTALKVTLNKYLEGMGTTGIGPRQRLRERPTRSTGWPARTRAVPGTTYRGRDAQRQLRARLRPAELPGQRRVRRAVERGHVRHDRRRHAATIPDLLRGWGKRINNWEFTASVQHELVPRVSLDVQYARRWYGNFRVTDDPAVTAADYNRFTVNVPSDSRLPNGGGTVTAFDLTPAANARAAAVPRHARRELRRADRGLRRREHLGVRRGCRTA